MQWRNILAIALLAFIGILIGGAVLWFILRYLPLIVALILAFIVAFVIITVIAAFVGFFTTAVGALYYSLTKKPKIAGKPMKIEDVRRINKEKGVFKQEEDTGE